MAIREGALEKMGVMPHREIWQGMPVFVTGHTGFKGSWLTTWLDQLGARVSGYALPPPTTPNMFGCAGIAQLLEHDTRADLADLAALRASLHKAQPTVVFHLAAQPLVRESYQQPIETLTTNILGTAHLLEAIRTTPSVKAVVIITTDKVYENKEWRHPYRENDALGGHDPYSASKAATEIVLASYRASFFAAKGGHPAIIASARAGNVIGGGDWAADRLVPDCLSAFARGEAIKLRYPRALRPWQHVLEPLAGYLQLAEHLLSEEGNNFADAWNFGPDLKDEATVESVAMMVAQQWGKDAAVQVDEDPHHPHETSTLRLDSTSARTLLQWAPRWTLNQAISKTVEWHKAWLSGVDIAQETRAQIKLYESSRS